MKKLILALTVFTGILKAQDSTKVESNDSLICVCIINMNASHKADEPTWRKVTGLTYFGLSYASLLVLPYTLPSDKILHVSAGWVIGAGSTYTYYRLTKNKWVSTILGSATSGAVGLGKEYIWDKNRGGIVSNKDALATFLGGVFGALGVRIVIK